MHSLFLTWIFRLAVSFSVCVMFEALRTHKISVFGGISVLPPFIVTFIVKPDNLTRIHSKCVVFVGMTIIHTQNLVVNAFYTVP